MKNITVSVDDETYWLSRIIAAGKGSSISDMLREYLTNMVRNRASGPTFEELEKDQDELIESVLKTSGGLRPSENLSRDELHNRNALR